MVTSVAMTAEVTKTFAGSTTGGSTAKPHIHWFNKPKSLRIAKSVS